MRTWRLWGDPEGLRILLLALNGPRPEPDIADAVLEALGMIVRRPAIAVVAFPERAS